MKSDAILDLIDEQLRDGEPQTGYDYGDPTFPRCPHCDRPWHGLPLTQKIVSMYGVGRYDPSYVASEDDTPMVCEGSSFIGCLRPTPTRSSDIHAVYITPYDHIANMPTGTILNDYLPGPITDMLQGFVNIERLTDDAAFRIQRSSDVALLRFRRMVTDFIELAETFTSIANSITITIPSVELHRGFSSISFFDETYSPPPPPCADVDVRFGPDNWIHEFRSTHVPMRPWGLLRDVNRLWNDAIPHHPMPKSPGYDFAGWEIPGHGTGPRTEVINGRRPTPLRMRVSSSRRRM